MLGISVGKPSNPLPGQLWLRIGILAALTTAGFAVLAVSAIRGSLAGSYSAVLLALPVLAILIASGLRPAPGVGDTEFDWIVAAVVGATGFLAVALLSQRLPSIAGLWNWSHFGPVVWAMAAGTVLFSARHVLRLWRVWLFVLCLVPATPFLLFTAALGGTENSAVLAGGVVGAIAVYLATSTVGLSWRLLAAVVDLGVATGLGHLLGGLALVPRMAVVAGAVPVLSVAAVRWANHVRLAPSLAAHPARGSAGMPPVGARSYGVLGILAVALVALSPPVSNAQPQVLADRDWIDRMGLVPVADFGFIRLFLGPEASLTRYVMPGNTDPAVAIDVISAPNLARLADYSDAVWYPSAVPVNHRRADVGETIGLGARSVHSDPDTVGGDGNWYALSWLWRTDPGYQQVIVAVDQDLSAQRRPPIPEPLTWTNSLLSPMLWLTRQQPPPSGAAPKKVVRTADEVARQIIEAGTA